MLIVDVLCMEQIKGKTMEKAIEIVRNILAETTPDRYPKSGECMAARFVLLEVLDKLRDNNASKDAPTYFQHQKELLE